MTLEELVKANLSRVKRWHPLDSWSALEWAGAMAGEAGEACNAAKKFKRVEDGIANISSDPARQIDTLEAARTAIEDEVADTVIYGVLLVLRVGGDLEAGLVRKFNAVSERYGFPERLS